MRISVVTAAYNAEATLAEPLASVLGQTLCPDEIIVVDDGSTDDTQKIAASASGRIRVLHLTNQGAPAAINAGINLATGDYLAFIDADDLWAEDKLAVQMGLLSDRPGLHGAGGYVSTFLCPTNDCQTNMRYRVPD